MGKSANNAALPALDVPAPARSRGRLTDILNRQAALLARSEEVHRALVQVVLVGGGLEDVTDELVALLGGVVLAATPDGRVLAMSGDPDTAAELVAGRHFDQSGRLRVERLRTGAADDQDGGRTLSHAVVPAAAGRVQHGHIAAFRDRALDASDVHALEWAATVAALVITKSLAVAAVEGKYQGDFLHDLISGRAASVDDSIAHSASLGWDIDRPLVVVVAEIDPADPTEPRGTAGAVRPLPERFAAAWSTVVRRRDPAAAVAGFAQEVVALLGVPQSGEVDHLIRDIVGAVSGDGGGGRRSFSTGVSRIVVSPSGLPHAYEQARRAVQVGRQLSGTSAVAHFDGLGVFRLLSLIPDSSELRSFVADTLGPLAVHDDAEANDLRRTLQVLLEANLNVAETARSLHFHYNTLRYRICKLERMLGPFTTDPALRLSLVLALQVRRMRGI